MPTTNQYLINVTRKSDGRDFGNFQTLSEWDKDSAEVFNRDTYGGVRKSLGAPGVWATLTASKAFYVDLDSDIGELEEETGSGELFIVTRQGLTPKGVAVGFTRQRECTLKRLTLSAVDVGTDDPEVAMVTIELTPQA